MTIGTRRPMGYGRTMGRKSIDKEPATLIDPCRNAMTDLTPSDASASESNFSELDLVKLKGKHHASMTRGYLDAHQKQHTELIKWLTAALLTINSGGSLFLTKVSQNYSNIGVTFSMLCFISSIILIFCFVFKSMTLHREVQHPLNNLIHYWMKVELTGKEGDEAAVSFNDALADAANKRGKPEYYFVLSGILTVLGLILAHLVLSNSAEAGPFEDARDRVQAIARP